MCHNVVMLPFVLFYSSDGISSFYTFQVTTRNTELCADWLTGVLHLYMSFVTYGCIYFETSQLVLQAFKEIK